MQLIAITIEHQLPHMHAKQNNNCLVCMHKHTVIVCDDAATEAYSLSAGVQHMSEMRADCDKAKLTLQHVQECQRLLTWLQQTKQHAINAEISEYLYFIDNNAPLARQLLETWNIHCVEQQKCVQVIFTKIATALKRKTMDSINEVNIHCNYGIYASATTLIERNDAHAICFKRYMHNMLHEYYNRGLVCYFFGMRIATKDFVKRYNITHNIFAVYRRIMDINLLTAAPYGTVTIGVKTFCLANDSSLVPLICLAHSMPAAHRLAIHTQDEITAVVSVANVHSLSDEKKQSLCNYAIYLPYDIDAAIYLRFGVAGVAQVLLDRLNKLKNATVLTTLGERLFRCIHVSIFFDRGVFCAHMDDAELQDNIQVDALRLELIDIYRNAHWMGLNIFHKDMSLIFPRIMLRLGDAHESEVKLKSTTTKLCVLDILTEIQVVLQQSCEYVAKLRSSRPELYNICKVSVDAAMDSDFALAHESLRLALSMTHTSVHKYAEQLVHSDLDAYVRIAILYAGYTQCDCCRKLYSDVTTNITYLNTLAYDYNTTISRLSLLESREYVLQRSINMTKPCGVNVHSRIMETMFFVCQSLSMDITISELSTQMLCEQLHKQNTRMRAIDYLSRHPIKRAPHIVSAMLNIIIKTQITNIDDSIHKRRKESDIQEQLGQLSGNRAIQYEPVNNTQSADSKITLHDSALNQLDTDSVHKEYKKYVNSSTSLQTNCSQFNIHVSSNCKTVTDKKSQALIATEGTTIGDIEPMETQEHNAHTEHIQHNVDAAQNLRYVYTATERPQCLLNIYDDNNRSEVDVVPVLSLLRKYSHFTYYELCTYYNYMFPQNDSLLYGAYNNVIERAYNIVQQLEGLISPDIQRSDRVFRNAYRAVLMSLDVRPLMRVSKVPKQIDVTDIQQLEAYIAQLSADVITCVLFPNRSLMATMYGHLSETLCDLSEYIIVNKYNTSVLVPTLLNLYLLCYDLTYVSYVSMKQ